MRTMRRPSENVVLLTLAVLFVVTYAIVEVITDGQGYGNYVFLVAAICSVLYVVVVAFMMYRKAIRAGMTRPVPGLAVVVDNESIEIRRPRKKSLRILKSDVTRARHVHDNLFDRPAGLADTLILCWGESNQISIPETAEGYGELITWARNTVPLEVTEVQLD